MMDNELREILHDCVQNAIKGSSGYLDSAAFDSAEQAIRRWAEGLAPEKRKLANEVAEPTGDSEYDDERDLSLHGQIVGWNAAIDAYVRKVRGQNDDSK